MLVVMKNISRIKTIFVFIVLSMFIIPNFCISAETKGTDFFKTKILKEIEPGDIVFCEIRDIWILLGGHDVKKGFDHVAIYRGKGHVNFKGEFVEDKIFGRHYVIESTYFPFPKVRYTPLSLLFSYSKLYFAKVKDADETVKNNAISFAESQLGCSYQHFFYMAKKDNPRFMWDYTIWDENDPAYKFRKHVNNNPDDPLDPLSDWYYCADLVWASYYNTDIDLDPKYPEDFNKDGEPDIIEGYGLLRYVSPQNIYDSVNTTPIEIS
jgi:hypothetical protein